MSDPERAKELSRLWQGAIVPVAEQADEAARRDRVVPAIGRAIERAASERSRAARRRHLTRILAAAAGVLLLAGAARFAATGGDAEATVALAAAPAGSLSVASGDVTLVRGAERSATHGGPLAEGDAVVTAADAAAEVRLADLVVASVGGSSELSVVRPRAALHRLRLDRGRIDARVDDRVSATPKLVVETPNVEVVVTGTIFHVDVLAATDRAAAVTGVSVEKGRVVIRRDGQEVAAVSAGQSWSSAPPLEASPAPSPPAGTEVTDGGGARRPRTGSGAGPEEPSGTLAVENRLFQDALDARRRGDSATAAARMGELLVKYPGSPLAGEARVERMRALEKQGRLVEAAREARRYLAEFPEGFARDEARKLVMQDGTATSAGELPPE